MGLVATCLGFCFLSGRTPVPLLPYTPALFPCSPAPLLLCSPAPLLHCPVPLYSCSTAPFPYTPAPLPYSPAPLPCSPAPLRLGPPASTSRPPPVSTPRRTTLGGHRTHGGGSRALSKTTCLWWNHNWGGAPVSYRRVVSVHRQRAGSVGALVVRGHCHLTAEARDRSPTTCRTVKTPSRPSTAAPEQEGAP